MVLIYLAKLNVGVKYSTSEIIYGFCVAAINDFWMSSYNDGTSG